MKTSKYIGVSFHKGIATQMTEAFGLRTYKSPAWRANIFYDHKQRSLGRFVSEKSAAIAYNKAATEIHGEFARLNIIE